MWQRKLILFIHQLYYLCGVLWLHKPVACIYKAYLHMPGIVGKYMAMFTQYNIIIPAE